MSLAGTSVAEVKELIDRGVAADGKSPDGTAYLVSTDDVQRNVRAKGYEKTQSLLRRIIPTEIVKANYIEGCQDVMFYFTGLSEVPHVKDNTYLPGAMGRSSDLGRWRAAGQGADRQPQLAGGWGHRQLWRGPRAV